LKRSEAISAISKAENGYQLPATSGWTEIRVFTAHSRRIYGVLRGRAVRNAEKGLVLMVVLMVMGFFQFDVVKPSTDVPVAEDP
jgi:hypothetical protein